MPTELLESSANDHPQDREGPWLQGNESPALLRRVRRCLVQCYGWLCHDLKGKKNYARALEETFVEIDYLLINEEGHNKMRQIVLEMK